MNSADSLSLQELNNSAIALTGDSTIMAAVIFAVQDEYKKLFRSVLSQSFWGPFVALYAQDRERMKIAKNLGYDNFRVVIAASADNIYVINLDLNKVHHAIKRDSVQISIKKFGVSRHIHLENQQTHESFRFMGGTSPLSSVAKGDIAVIQAIS